MITGKVIFIHIPKCCGSSMAILFKKEIVHHTAYHYATNYNYEWSIFPKYTIVRNPLERFVSLYHYTLINPHNLQNKFQKLAKTGFNNWLKTNIRNYIGDFELNSIEGGRETQFHVGSSFWFSSQLRRLTDDKGKLYPGIKIFKYHEGMQPVNSWLRWVTKQRIFIPHINKSEHQQWQSYYDNELLNIASNFKPVIEDKNAFGF